MGKQRLLLNPTFLIPSSPILPTSPPQPPPSVYGLPSPATAATAPDAHAPAPAASTDRPRMLLSCRSLSSWVRRLVACMGGCLGCCNKPTPIISVNEPSKGLRIQGRSIRRASLSEDFWSTSAHEIENSTIQSQRSMSSMSTVAQSSDQHGAGSSSNPNEFVNQGLILWNQIRQQWVGNKKPNSRPQQSREPKVCSNATYESLLGSNKPFSQPIPLAEMVDLLVDAWEQEGLYD